MAHETGSIEFSHDTTDRLIGPLARGPAPLGVPRLLLSVIFIAVAAIGFSCLLAMAAVLLFYVHLGTDGLSEFYQEWRFNFRLKTLIGALVVGTLYVGAAFATILAAVVRAKDGWYGLVAWSHVSGQRRTIVAIVATTLLYGAGAALAMALMRDNRMIVSGSTDYALVGTIAINLVLLAPIAEELFFRGWLYTGLRAKLPFWPSFLATAALFAAIHWDASHRRILLVLPLAIAVGLLREVTGSIKPTIALHGAYNFVIIAITLLET